MKTYFEQIRSGQWHDNFSIFDARAAINYMHSYLNVIRPYTIYCAATPWDQWSIFDYLNKRMRGHGGEIPIGLGSDILKDIQKENFVPDGDRPSGKLFMLDASAPIVYDKAIKLYPNIDMQVMNALLDLHRNSAICSALCGTEYVVVCKYPKSIDYNDECKITKVIWK